MRSICSLNTGWAFCRDCADVQAAFPAQWERVTLPHTWNAEDGQDGGNDYFRGTCCYVREIAADELPQAERYVLHIPAANASADVYLNGVHLTHHDGGYSAFRADLTESLKEKNLLCILVDNGANDTVYPQTADFTFYGGLYRGAEIIAVPGTHFALEPHAAPGIRVTPVMRDGAAHVEIRTQPAGLQPGDAVRVRILDARGACVQEREAEDGAAVLIMEKPRLWHGVKDPYLYTAEAAILRGGEEIDRVAARFGCRSFEIDPQRGFILNGKEYPLRGVSRHQDRKGIGNALLPEHHLEDMDLICEVGANTIRLAHYQHDQYFYDLCDERGMVVWAEIPYISRHMETGNANAVSQMTELVAQCFNHPSIVVWGLSNEITMDGAGDPDLIRQHHLLNDLVHSMDPTRKTVIACISMCAPEEAYVHIPDVVSYNHYFGWYGGDMNQYGPWFDHFHKKYPSVPIGVSEYGCEALNWHNSAPQAGDYSEEYQAVYHEAVILQLFTRPYLWATHVWNMFDFGADARAEGGENGQNHKGLVTFDRRYKKDAFYAYKAWLSDEPFVHICGRRYADRTEDVTKVTVYSNLPEVELFANGQSLGRKTAEDHFFRFDVPNAGETVLRAEAGDCRDEIRIRKVEEMNPDYILREQGAVLNWFDVTTAEGYFSLNDKLSEIMKPLRGKLWVAGMGLMLMRKQREATNAREGGKRRSGGKMKKGGMIRMNRGLIEMIGGFTVLRLTSMLPMLGIHVTKEELLSMNRRLNRIRRPKNHP